MRIKPYLLYNLIIIGIVRSRIIYAFEIVGREGQIWVDEFFDQALQGINTGICSKTFVATLYSRLYKCQ